MPADAVALKQIGLSTIPKNIPAMALSLDLYRAKLIKKILQAASQDGVKRLITMAIKSLEHHKLNGHIVARFLEKTLAQLELLDPMKKSAQQWSNIQMARIQLNRIINQIKLPVV